MKKWPLIMIIFLFFEFDWFLYLMIMDIFLNILLLFHKLDKFYQGYLLPNLTLIN